jgi:DNA-binding transcriptional ArsR family regulator
MVKFNAAPLDRTFAALADPTRRILLTRLAEQPGLSVSALAEPFAISLPAIMKHLDVLSDAGLVARSKTGRTVNCHLNAAPMRDAIAWLNRYERFWSEALSRLAVFLEEEESCPSNQSSSQVTPSQVPSSQVTPHQHPASPSSAASTRRPPKSSPPGPTRKK